MRIVCISDTHDMQELTPEVIPDGDVLIHAGDLTKRGTFMEISKVGQELARLPHTKKLVIAGNHDKLFQVDNGLARVALGDGHNGIIYLQDQSWLIQEDLDTAQKKKFIDDKVILLWGSPWTPRFYDWSFQLDQRRPEDERPFLLVGLNKTFPLGSMEPRFGEDHWKYVPGPPLDILITHGPPKGILDLVHHGLHVGDPDLLVAVDRVRPKLHVFGHIHTSPGVVELDGTVFVNACLCDNAYRMIHKPVVLDYEDGKVTIVTR